MISTQQANSAGRVAAATTATAAHEREDGAAGAVKPRPRALGVRASASLEHEALAAEEVEAVSGVEVPMHGSARRGAVVVVPITPSGARRSDRTT